MATVGNRLALDWTDLTKSRPLQKEIGLSIHWMDAGDDLPYINPFLESSVSGTFSKQQASDGDS